MKKEKKTLTKSFRLSEETYEKLASMAKYKQCSESQVITDALLNNSERLDTKALYKVMMRIHDTLIPIEQKSNVNTTGIRMELMEICRILNSKE